MNSLNAFTTANEFILPWDISRRRNTNCIGKQNTTLELEKTDVQSCLTVTLLTYCGQNRVQFKDIIKTLQKYFDLKTDEATATKLVLEEPNILSWLLKYTTSLVAIANLPHQDQQKAVTELALKLNEKPNLRKIFPSFIVNIGIESNRYLAMLNCAITGLAIERYRITNGKWPRKLDELVPEYLAKLPTDPFNGEPLLVGTILGGLVIYSVGPDLQDNNGLIDDSNSNKEGTDIGFRLWEVPMRRQPAIAK